MQRIHQTFEGIYWSIIIVFNHNNTDLSPILDIVSSKKKKFIIILCL